MNLPIGISDFEELVEGDFLFADKSLLIEDIIKDSAKVILITRPRRFGKTLNLSMLYYFLRKNHSHTENLFKGLKISENKTFCTKHQQQYPVIFITFKSVQEASYANAYDKIKVLMSELYEDHSYLLDENLLSTSQKTQFMAVLDQKANLANTSVALKQLSVYMKKKFKKRPIILIDEYDTPIQEAHLRENYQGEVGYYQDMIDLMRSILGEALKDNKTLGKAIVTGITRIAQESLFSGVNNLEVYSLLREDYGQYFGFLEEEVSKLLAESRQKISIASIKEWYNGYQVGKYVLYNPWSIISCLKNNGELKPYWVNTSSNDLIFELLNRAKPAVKQQFEELLQGNVIEQPIAENLIFSDIKTSAEALWSLLLYAGYLKVLSKELRDYALIAKLAIPNKEVGFVYNRIVSKWFSDAIDIDSYNKFVQSLADGDTNKFKSYLSAYIMQTGSYFDFNKKASEQIFHVFVLGLVVGLRDQYYIHSNQESGLGRFDVIFIPKNKQAHGILLEFKTSDTVELLLNKAQEALNQIKDKRYMEAFKQHNINSVLAIGLAFFGKQMELVHENLVIV